MGSTARAALFLTAGRTFGFVVLFIVPLVLSRHLTQQEFGTYKYLFLLAGTLGVLQLGMAESLYYFIPKERDRAGRAVVNALLTLVGTAAVAFVGVSALATRIAAWSGNPEIEPYLPALGAFLAVTLLSSPLEIMMVSRKQHRFAALTYALSDTLRAAMIVVPGILTRDVGMIMLGAAVLGVMRCVAMFTYVAREFRGQLHLDAAVWKTQLAYALPFTAAVVIEVVQMNLHQYVVAARFDAALFAIYSVGCMQIPLVDLLATSTANVMMVRMTEQLAEGQAVVAIWLDAVQRLAFVFVPFVAALVLTARELIAFLYPASYLPSVPVFVLSTGLIALAAFPVDGVLRVFAQTRFLIVMNLVRLAVVLIGISWALGHYGLQGAIGITVVAQGAAKLVAIARIKHILHARWAHVLPWRALGEIAAASIVAVAPAWWMHHELALPPLLEGAVTATTYAVAYLVIMGALQSSLREQVARQLGWQRISHSGQ